MHALFDQIPFKLRHGAQHGEDHFPIGVDVSMLSDNETKSIPR